MTQGGRHMNKQIVQDEPKILLAARKRLELTQQQVAVKADITLRHYQMFESGERKLSTSSFLTASRVLSTLALDLSTFASGEYAVPEMDKHIQGDTKMNKYTVYRSLGDLDRDIKKHIIVAVEYGEDIHAVTDALIKAVCDDALGIEKYQQWYTASAYAPEPVGSSRRVKRYAYSMTAVLSPDNGGVTDLVDYGITEQAGSEPD